MSTPAAALPVRRLPSWLLGIAALAIAMVWLAGRSVEAASAPVLTISRAMVVASAADQFPATPPAVAVKLPDDWSANHPGLDGSLWYRTAFDAPPALQQQDLLALYIARACSNVEVHLNGHRIYSGGRMDEPVARNCYYPQLVTLPAAWLQPANNQLDLRVQGHALERVAARQRAGGLSELRIGPLETLKAEHEQQLSWNITTLRAVNLTLAVLGGVIVAMGWLNRREVHMAYFGWLALGLALTSARTWARDLPLDNATVEWLACVSFAPLVALAVQFLLSYVGLRSRVVEIALLLQCVLLAVSLQLAGPEQLFAWSRVWYAVLVLELAAAMAVHLRVVWRTKRQERWTLAIVLLAVGLCLGIEVVVQRGWMPRAPVNLLQIVVPLLFVGVGARLLQNFGRAMQAAEAGRNTLENRVQEITAEIERNFAQLAELRVEQVTEKERKRIAGDLHDDLGAKLLTIVHTSENERISTLAREALEEMRLSVRGLTGKPMRLADALADWRAETVSRLGQANIEADWRSPPEEVEQLLPARGYVQTTRILREAVSNIIKHSGATHCKVRCAIADRQFGLTVQDNGRGIPMELDGKLDRGHGMSSMKHRAKQMQGQCLVESGPGYGTVIRLTLPL